MTFKLIKILVLILAAVPAAAQSATNDLFNRPNNNSLGVDWTEQDGDAKIANNALLANSNFQFGWCSHNAFSANYASTVVRANWATNGGGGDAFSLIAGLDPNSWSGIEVRIADNDGDGLSDRIFFNAAVNAGNWYGGSYFANIATPMASGEATIWFSNAGDTVNVKLRDPMTNFSQTYSASGILASPPTGTRVGIGYFGNGSLDDFRAWVGSPNGPVYTITTARIGHAPTLLVTDAAPWSYIVIGYSTAGAGPIATPFGPVNLTEPIAIFLESYADTMGRLEIPAGPLTGVPGITIYTQAADLSQSVLTNSFAVTIL